MPQAAPLPPIDAVLQTQTCTLDFGDGPYLPAGVTLIGTPSVTISVETGADPLPNSRILVPPQIGTASKPLGSGRANCAVLVQIGSVPLSMGEGQYVIECVCGLSNNDVATMDVILPVRIPPNLQ